MWNRNSKWRPPTKWKAERVCYLCFQISEQLFTASVISVSPVASSWKLLFHLKKQFKSLMFWPGHTKCCQWPWIRSFSDSGVLPRAEPALVEVDLDTSDAAEHNQATINEKTTIGKLWVTTSLAMKRIVFADCLNNVKCQHTQKKTTTNYFPFYLKVK